MKIKKFNEQVIDKSGLTLGDLRKMIEGLPDDTPIVYVNPVDRGDNMSNPFDLQETLLGSDGLYHVNSHLTDENSDSKLSLMIYSL